MTFQHLLDGAEVLAQNGDPGVSGVEYDSRRVKPGCLFVRLSKETVNDTSFLSWLDGHIRSSHAEPQHLCFQVPESIAASHVEQLRGLASALRQRRFRFALEAFGGVSSKEQKEWQR